jgi:hypothetical protein
MRACWSRICLALGVDARALGALSRAFLLMDLRQQHYASATATKPQHIISPLFWVIGQCLTASAALSLFLFARTDVFFFSFANLSLSLLVLASVIFVEFQELILNPHDLSVIGHRAVSWRTYSVARFANLLFFVALTYTALNLIPMVMGFGLRDASFWYIPAYFIASLSGSLILVAILVLLLSFAGTSRSFDGLRAVLSWTQIVLILVIGYGGQFMLRDTSYLALMWGAFPPDWIEHLPSQWLAAFVSEACYSPSWQLLWQGLAMLSAAGLACAMAVLRLNQLYSSLQPAGRQRKSPPRGSRPSGLASLELGWLERVLPSAEERVGFWICRTHLFRDARLFLRCLLPFHLPVAFIILGVLLDQWANPLTIRDPARVTLSILSVYLFVVAVPAVIHQLSFCEDNLGSWILLAAPLASPGAFVRGLCKAIIVFLVFPFAVVLGIVAGVAWQDWISAGLHLLLILSLAWPAALAGVWLLLRSVPFSLEPARGGALGIPPLPLAVVSTVALFFTTLHYFLARHALFWILAVPVVVLMSIWLNRKAEAQVQKLWRPV